MALFELPLAMTIGPFWLLLLALPVLLGGEWLTHRVRWLLRCNVPPAIVGGLIVAVGLFIASRVSPGLIEVAGSTASPFWHWVILPQWDFTAPRAADVERPLLILFFTCIGLNASWRIAREGGLPLVFYLAVAALIAVLQASGGVAVATLLGEQKLLGVMTSNVSLMGGFGTAAGFAPEFEKAGLTGAATIGLAAAAFGVIAGGIVAGLIGGRLVEKRLGKSPRDLGAGTTAEAAAPDAPDGPDTAHGFLAEVRELFRDGRGTLVHLVALLACMKLGAFVSAFIQQAGITFPVYMGSMIVAAILRNAHDASEGRWLRTESTDAIGSVALMWLLAVVMIDLQLAQLANAAVPMLVILATQVALIAGLSYWLVFRVMGRDYEAAVMSAGMIGFGLGATSNALATMRVLVRRFGPAPRAFLIVPIVGAFLIDFINAIITTTLLNFLK